MVESVYLEWLKYLTSNSSVVGSFHEHLSRDNHLIHFKYSLNQVQLSTEAGGERERDSLSRTNSANIRRKKRAASVLCVLLCDCVNLCMCVFSYKRMCAGVCLCAHLTVQSHACMRQCYRQPVVLQQKAERVCGGEIRTASLLQGLAPPAHRQTQVRQTSFDVSTE